jgi:hypothetical protein
VTLILLEDYMPTIRSVAFLVVITSCAFLFSQEQVKPLLRDPMLLDVLARVINTAGGAQRLAAVQGLSESGEITFYWRENIKGPVTIRSLGWNHFRLEADLPQGKRIWLVNDAVGSRKETDQKPVALPYANAINLESLTFPVAYVVAALADPEADISLVGIDKSERRTIYHVRLKGRLGLVEKGPAGGPIVKDVLIDALSFEILAVEDFPYSRKSSESSKSSKSNEKIREVAPREITYEDFRVVNGLRVPFSISTKLEGQRTFSLHLTEATFNANLTDGDFAQ